MSRTVRKLLSTLQEDLRDAGYKFDFIRNHGTDEVPDIEIVWGVNPPDDAGIDATIAAYTWTEEKETSEEIIAALKARLDTLEAQ